MIRPRAGLRAAQAGVALMAVCGPAFANAARLGGGEEPHVSLWRIMAALLVAVVLIVFAALLIRQRGGKPDLAPFLDRVRPRAREIDVVETRRLSPHADICLVRHGRREYLLLLGAGHGSVLSSIAIEPNAEAGTIA